MSLSDETSRRCRADDLSALAWVHGELRRSLESAHKALRRYLKEAAAAVGSDVDAVDPAVLRQAARASCTRASARSRLVGLPAVADVLRAGESAVQRLVAQPEHRRRGGGRDDRARLVRAARLPGPPARRQAGVAGDAVPAVPRARSSWPAPTASIRPTCGRSTGSGATLPADAAAAPRAADDDARSAMETLVLAMMREPAPRVLRRAPERPVRRHSAQARVARDAAAGDLLAAGRGLLRSAGRRACCDTDVYVKRVASRLLAQLRASVRGDDERVRPAGAGPAVLLQPCARRPTTPTRRRGWPRCGRPGGSTPRRRPTTRSRGWAASTRRCCRWRASASRRPSDAGRPWPAARCHRLPALASSSRWSAIRCSACCPAGEALAQCAADGRRTDRAGRRQRAAAGAGDGSRHRAAVPRRVARGRRIRPSPSCAERVQPPGAAHRRGAQRRAGPQPLEPWMEELYRRVSDRQTMGSVVQELRASLSEVEKQIDQYFRDPARRERADPGAGAAVGDARRAVGAGPRRRRRRPWLRMRDDVDALARRGRPARASRPAASTGWPTTWAR